MSARPTSISALWLDDEHRSAYERALAPWRRVFKQHEQAQRLRLVTCSTLDDFKNLVVQSQADGQPYGLLVLDVMLNLLHLENYELFGFPDEEFIALDAGVQIAGLIRNSSFDHGRPDWLNALRDTPMILLTANPMVTNGVKQLVGARRVHCLEVVTKDLRPHREGHDAAPEFDVAICKLLHFN